MVQLASFSKRDNALALRDALRSKGHNASVTTSADGTLHRLLVGPYRTPATAADAVIALRSETKLAGVVRRTDSL
jgi:cell division septation protein DedD